MEAEYPTAHLSVLRFRMITLAGTRGPVLGSFVVFVPVPNYHWRNPPFPQSGHVSWFFQQRNHFRQIVHHFIWAALLGEPHSTAEKNGHAEGAGAWRYLLGWAGRAIPPAVLPPQKILDISS
jgi:hypothetical protein